MRVSVFVPFALLPFYSNFNFTKLWKKEDVLSNSNQYQQYKNFNMILKSDY